MVGITDEVAVGEEQQLDDVPAQIPRLRSGLHRLGRRNRAFEIYVRHVDVSWFQCYKKGKLREIFGNLPGT
jgi:hypothetical protein